jgi:pimeloyl-ACP methyl ester carboxylesterase
MQLELSKEYQIHYQLIAGDANKPYLVFLHEGLGCIQMWKGFVELLCSATGCPGLVYDRLGYGESSALTTQRTIHYLHEYALRELPNVLNNLIPQQPYVVIGHSDGGSIGLIHASEQPTLLKAVITEAAHVFVEKQTLAGIKDADVAWDLGKLTGLGKYHGPKTAQIFKAWADTWQTPAFADWNIEYLLSSIQVPILAIQGKEDQYGSDQQVARIVSKVKWGKADLIDNCAHAPHLEAQSNVINSICQFLQDELGVSEPKTSSRMPF